MSATASGSWSARGNFGACCILLGVGRPARDKAHVCHVLCGLYFQRASSPNNCCPFPLVVAVAFGAAIACLTSSAPNAFLIRSGGPVGFEGPPHFLPGIHIHTHARRVFASPFKFSRLTETAVHFTAIGLPAQQHCESFRFRRAAFYNGLKSKVGLAAAKAAALRVNLNIDGCGVVAPPAGASSTLKCIGFIDWHVSLLKPPPLPPSGVCEEACEHACV